MIGSARAARRLQDIVDADGSATRALDDAAAARAARVRGARGSGRTCDAGSARAADLIASARTASRRVGSVDATWRRAAGRESAPARCSRVRRARGVRLALQTVSADAHSIDPARDAGRRRRSIDTARGARPTAHDALHARRARVARAHRAFVTRDARSRAGADLAGSARRAGGPSSCRVCTRRGRAAHRLALHALVAVGGAGRSRRARDAEATATDEVVAAAHACSRGRPIDARQHAALAIRDTRAAGRSGISCTGLVVLTARCATSAAPTACVSSATRDTATHRPAAAGRDGATTRPAASAVRRTAHPADAVTTLKAFAAGISVATPERADLRWVDAHAARDGHEREGEKQAVHGATPEDERDQCVTRLSDSRVRDG